MYVEDYRHWRVEKWQEAGVWKARATYPGAPDITAQATDEDTCRAAIQAKIDHFWLGFRYENRSEV